MAEPKIVFEDNSILVLMKPEGVVVTNENRKTGSETIEDWIGNRYPNHLPRKGIVHRLDKGTSGLLLVAKDGDSLIDLKRQFKQRQTVKHYLALVCGDTPLNGSITMPIGRSRYALKKFRVDEDGKAAVTEFKRVERYKIESKIFSLLEINLKTGRTHQIRVHMAYLGWPLAGDSLYGNKKIEGLNRMFLHAKYLKFVHPKNGEVMEFDSQIPDELMTFINGIQKV